MFLSLVRSFDTCNRNLTENWAGVGGRDYNLRKITCYRPVILHALKSFLYLTTKHASGRAWQSSLKKQNDTTSRPFPIVLLINSFIWDYMLLYRIRIVRPTFVYHRFIDSIMSSLSDLYIQVASYLFDYSNCQTAPSFMKLLYVIQQRSFLFLSVTFSAKLVQ